MQVAAQSDIYTVEVKVDGNSLEQLKCIIWALMHVSQALFIGAFLVYMLKCKHVVEIFCHFVILRLSQELYFSLIAQRAFSFFVFF